MSDEDPTWKRSGESQRRRDRMRAPTPQTDPIPVLLDDVVEEITAPIDLLDGDLTDSQLDLVRRSRRNSGDHATVADLAKIYDRQDKKERSDQVTNREVKKLLERLESAAAIDKRVAALEGIAGWGKKLGALVVGAVLSSAGYVVTKVQDRAELQGETTIRLKHIEEAIERLRDHDDRRYPFAPAQTDKDKP